MTSAKERRKTVRWTPEEVEELKKGVRDHGAGKWATILRYGQFNEVRTSVDLKDKWRNLTAVRGLKSAQPDIVLNTSTQVENVVPPVAPDLGVQLAQSVLQPGQDWLRIQATLGASQTSPSRVVNDPILPDCIKVDPALAEAPPFTYDQQTAQEVQQTAQEVLQNITAPEEVTTQPCCATPTFQNEERGSVSYDLVGAQNPVIYDSANSFSVNDL